MSERVRPVRLLQITLIVEDLPSTESRFRDVLGLEVAFRDPGVAQWGLENAVLPLGTTFIELLSPTSADAPGARHLARQGGDGGYMVILQVDALDPWRAPLGEAGVRIAWEGETSGTVHGADWAGFHLHPRDTGGLMISLDRPDPPDSWAGAGPDWRDFVRQDVVDGLVAIELESLDPERLGDRWAQVLGRERDGEGRLVLDAGSIGFRSSEAGREGLAAVRLRAVDRARAGADVTLGGTRFEFV